jgi:lipopolysaccharide transport system ATP-binding protein
MLGSSRLGLVPPRGNPSELVIFEMTLDLLLEAGNYSLTVNLGQLTAPNRGNRFDESPPLGPIVVGWDYEREEAPFLGMVGLPAQGNFKTITSATGDLT